MPTSNGKSSADHPSKPCSSSRRFMGASRQRCRCVETFNTMPGHGCFPRTFCSPFSQPTLSFIIVAMPMPLHPPLRNLRPLNTKEDARIVQFIRSQPPGVIRKAQWEPFAVQVGFPPCSIHLSMRILRTNHIPTFFFPCTQHPEHSVHGWMSKYAVHKADYNVLADWDPNYREPKTLRPLNIKDNDDIVKFLKLQPPGTACK